MIEQRLRRLERTNRIVISLLLLGGLGALLGAVANSSPDDIKTSRVILVDEDGNERASLDASGLTVRNGKFSTRVNGSGIVVRDGEKPLVRAGIELTEGHPFHEGYGVNVYRNDGAIWGIGTPGRGAKEGGFAIMKMGVPPRFVLQAGTDSDDVPILRKAESADGHVDVWRP